MPILYQIDGREVSLESFLANVHSDFERMAMAHIAETFSQKLGEVCCEEHGRTPTVTMVGQPGREEIKFEVGGCCDDLKTKTEAVLRELGGEQQTLDL